MKVKFLLSATVRWASWVDHIALAAFVLVSDFICFFKFIFLDRMVDDSGKSLVINILERNKFVRFTDVFASGFWSMARTEGSFGVKFYQSNLLDGRIFACGLNNFGQLGLPLPKIDENADGAFFK